MTDVLPWVRIQQVDPPGPYILVWLGDGYVKPSQEGGWETISRPKDVGFVNWSGTSPHTMDVPIVFDGYRQNVSMEPAIAQLYGMTRVPQGVRDEPPVVQVSGPIALTNKRWVIQNVDWVDEIRRDSDGARVRATCTLSLLEHIDPDVLIHSSPAKKVTKKRKATKTSTATSKRYTVRRGDTLAVIAQRTLHSSARWHDIAKLNGIRDPKNIRVGQVLRIP